MICHLCPRDCGAERTETRRGGVCGMPSVPVAARAMLHQWEEPCLVGEHGAGCVFFSGCNLRCCFCQNKPISQGEVGKVLTAERLREIFHGLIDQGAACLDLVTPTHFTDAVLEALGDEPWPVPVVWNCGGYEKPETLRRLEGKVQVYLPDLKYALPGPAAKYSGAADYFDWASRAILEMYRQTGPYKMENGLLTQGGALLPDGPVHPAAGGCGEPGPPCDAGRVPGGGGVHGKLRPRRRLYPGADVGEGGVHPGL